MVRVLEIFLQPQHFTSPTAKSRSKNEQSFLRSAATGHRLRLVSDQFLRYAGGQPGHDPGFRQHGAYHRNHQRHAGRGGLPGLSLLALDQKQPAYRSDKGP